MDEDIESIEKILAIYTVYGLEYTARTFKCDPSEIRDIVRRNAAFFDD